jgi:hypothetical protein
MNALARLLHDILNADPGAKPFWHSATFWGWVGTFLFFSLYMLGVPPETVIQWITAFGVAAGNTTVLIGTLRRSDISLVDQGG